MLTQGKQDLEDDFLVATIPYNLTLSPEGVAHTRFPALFAQLYADTRVPPDLVTALLLLVELHAGEERRTQDENEQASSKQQASERDQSGSFFAPYIELLPPPSRLDGAYSWGDTEWASLKFSPSTARTLTLQHSAFLTQVALNEQLLVKLVSLGMSDHMRPLGCPSSDVVSGAASLPAARLG